MSKATSELDLHYESQLRDAVSGPDRGAYITLYSANGVHPLEDAVEYAVERQWLVEAPTERGAPLTQFGKRYRLTAYGQAHFKIGVWSEK